MGYNNDGGCCGGGGYGFPFGGFMNGLGGFGFDALILLLFFGLMGGGMWGGWGGGFGGFGGGAGMLGTTSLAATETASLISQQNTADRVASIGADVRQILGQTGGIIEAVNTVGNRAQDGFARMDSNMCQLGNNIAMQAVNNHNNLTSQLTEMRFDASKCCCETNQNIQRLSTQLESVKCSTEQAISAAKAEILGAMSAQRMAELEAKNIELKGQISQANQTAAIVAAVQANGCNKTACTPCGPAYPYGFCNPCVDGVQRAVNDALGARIGELLFPTTTPATA